MIREKILEGIKEYAKEGKHLFLIGEHGAGKTYLIKRLELSNIHIFYFHDPKPPKQILLRILLELEGEENEKQFKRMAIWDLCDELIRVLKEKRKRIVLIIDEFHLANQRIALTLNYLLNAIEESAETKEDLKAITLILVATKPYYQKLYKKPEFKRLLWILEEFEFPELSNEEKDSIIQEMEKIYGVKLDEKQIKKIKKEAKTPLEIKQMIINYEREKKIAVKQEYITQQKAVNLFPYLIIVIVLLLALRYIMRGVDVEMGYFFSALSVVFLFLFRFLRK